MNNMREYMPFKNLFNEKEQKEITKKYLNMLTNEQRQKVLNYVQLHRNKAKKRKLNVFKSYLPKNIINEINIKEYFMNNNSKAINSNELINLAYQIKTDKLYSKLFGLINSYGVLYNFKNYKKPDYLLRIIYHPRVLSLLQDPYFRHKDVLKIYNKIKNILVFSKLKNQNLYIKIQSILSPLNSFNKIDYYYNND